VNQTSVINTYGYYLFEVSHDSISE
jgi:hypothetical protein